MRQFHLFLLLNVFVYCTPQEEDINLKIGNVIEYLPNGTVYITGSKYFTAADTVAIYFSKKEPFDIPVVKYVVSKNINGNQHIISEELIGVQPDTKFMRAKFLAGDLIKKQGYGTFKVQFFNGNNLIAEGCYSLIIK